jgi:hypothetical protein
MTFYLQLSFSELIYGLWLNLVLEIQNELEQVIPTSLFSIMYTYTVSRPIYMTLKSNCSSPPRGTPYKTQTS